jgi:tryptophan-rich sensory protein
MTGNRQWGMLVLFVAACLAVGMLGGWITAGSVGTWYPTLNKPSWTPPPWIFAPVWTLLYLMMGVAGWLVWRRGTSHPLVKPALLLFSGQLLLNLAWSLFFFGARSPGLALIDIAGLWLLLAATTGVFMMVSRAAGLLLLPYLAWVSFALALNLAVWRLN